MPDSHLQGQIFKFLPGLKSSRTLASLVPQGTQLWRRQWPFQVGLEIVRQGERLVSGHPPSYGKSRKTSETSLSCRANWKDYSTSSSSSTY